MSNNWNAGKNKWSAKKITMPIKLQQDADSKTYLSYDRELLLHYQGKGWVGSVYVVYKSTGTSARMSTWKSIRESLQDRYSITRGWNVPMRISKAQKNTNYLTPNKTTTSPCTSCLVGVTLMGG